jgi:hypothetical protein
MIDWESWRYLTGLEYLRDYYKPQTEVTFLYGKGSSVAKFKEWRGIISSLMAKEGKAIHASLQRS